jgi:hypothetical protein
MTREEAVIATAYNLGLGRFAPAHWGYPSDLIIDIGLEYRNMAHFIATLGHKANHRFDAKNAFYDVVDHPVVGGIACVVAGEEIDIGDEIFVDYNYDLEQGVPDWYSDALNDFVMDSALREIYPD